MQSVNAHPLTSPDESISAPLRRRNPSFALFLSLIYPGLGHLYVGLRKNALWIISMQTLSFLVIANGTGMLHGAAVLTVPSLYCFAAIDAYLDAREWNAGVTSLLFRTNPRIAATLNLLTKGFGYFYLGDRIKGIICFLLITAIQGVLIAHPNVWTSILGPFAQVLIAADGYRIARQRLYKAHPELAPAPEAAENVVDQANQGGLPHSIASALLAVIVVAMLLGYGTLRAIGTQNLKLAGTIEHGPNGLTYDDKSEHFALTVPEDWDFASYRDGSLMFKGDGCSIILLERMTLNSVGTLLDADQKSLLKHHTDAEITYPHLALGQRAAEGFEAVFKSKSGTLIHQRFIEKRRGLKVFFLVESWVDNNQRALLNRADSTVNL